MKSLYAELSEKLEKDPRLTKRGGPRYDLGLLLFNAREELRELWESADRHVQSTGCPSAGDLMSPVEKLRAIFGEKGNP